VVLWAYVVLGRWARIVFVGGLGLDCMLRSVVMIGAVLGWLEEYGLKERKAVVLCLCVCVSEKRYPWMNTVGVLHSAMAHRLTIYL